MALPADIALPFLSGGGFFVSHRHPGALPGSGFGSDLSDRNHSPLWSLGGTGILWLGLSLWVSPGTPL